MNRLTHPVVAHTLSGDALSPCAGGGGGAQDLTGADATDPPAEAPVDLFSVPAYDAPTEVNLVGLRRTLRGLVEANGACVSYLTDLSVHELGDHRHRLTPVELCGWLDQLQLVAEQTRSHATALHHVCEILWGRASSECALRRMAELELAKARRCPRCGGRGVLGPRDEFGNYDGCGLCEGTGVDPADPASPL